MMRGHRTAAIGVSVLLVVGVIAAGDPPSGAGTTRRSAPVPSSGCKRPGAVQGVRPPAGDAASTVTVDGVTHGYLLSVPDHYQPRRPTPLVLLFHEFGGDGGSMADLTRMPSKGAARGFIVVTPDGPNRTWQLSGHGTDAAFIDGLVSTLIDSLCVDLRRTYTSGYSQGAAFAIFYSCARPDRIAALATVAVDFQLGCQRPVPILAFHGTADPAVPYQNGASGLSLPGVNVRGTLLNMGDWAQLDHCGTTPKTTKVAEVTLATWPHCSNNTEVDLYTRDCCAAR